LRLRKHNCKVTKAAKAFILFEPRLAPLPADALLLLKNNSPGAQKQRRF
jgi:hypothetical protein